MLDGAIPCALVLKVYANFSTEFCLIPHKFSFVNLCGKKWPLRSKDRLVVWDEADKSHNRSAWTEMEYHDSKSKYKPLSKQTSGETCNKYREIIIWSDNLPNESCGMHRCDAEHFILTRWQSEQLGCWNTINLDPCVLAIDKNKHWPFTERVAIPRRGSYVVKRRMFEEFWETRRPRGLVVWGFSGTAESGLDDEIKSGEGENRRAVNMGGEESEEWWME
jgi:hypothetical protein